MECPKHNGAFDCTPFCELCGGDQELTDKEEKKMTTLTQLEKLAELERARETLDRQREHFAAGGLLLVSTDYGSGLTDYLKISAVITEDAFTIRQVALSLTWAVARALGYSLSHRNGQAHLAINGYGFSKSDQVARELADYYGLAKVLHDEI